MALVFSAVVPHPPLLLPTIGKEHAKQFIATSNALEEVARAFYDAQPDAVILLSPHGSNVPEALCMNVHTPYVADFTAFGDILTKPSWKNTPHLLTERLRHTAKIQNVPVVHCTEYALDYGTSIPLTYLLKQLPDLPVLPILTGSFSILDHFSIGKALHDTLLSSSSRIALVVSIDLSHRVTEESPEGFSPTGVAFDNLIKDIVSTGQLKRVLDITEEMDAEAQSCAARPLALAAGLLEGVHFVPQVYSYEQLFGTGYLVAHLTTP